MVDCNVYLELQRLCFCVHDCMPEHTRSRARFSAYVLVRVFCLPQRLLTSGQPCNGLTVACFGSLFSLDRHPDLICMTPRQQSADSGISRVCRQLRLFFFFVCSFFFPFPPRLSFSPSLSNSTDFKFRQRISRLWQKFMSKLRLSGIVRALY